MACRKTRRRAPRAVVLFYMEPGCPLLSRENEDTPYIRKEAKGDVQRSDADHACPVSSPGGPVLYHPAGGEMSLEGDRQDGRLFHAGLCPVYPGVSCRERGGGLAPVRCAIEDTFAGG